MDDMRNPHSVDTRCRNIRRGGEAPLSSRMNSIFLPVGFSACDQLTISEERDVQIASMAGEPSLLTDIAVDKCSPAISPYFYPKHIYRRVGINLDRNVDAGRARGGGCGDDERESAKEQ